MLLQIEGATLEDIREALSLLDSEPTITIVAEPEVPAAWRKLPPAGSQRQELLLKFLEGDFTRDDFRQFSGLSDGSIDPRIHELERGGHLVKTGAMRSTQYGRDAAVLTMTQETRRALRREPTKWFPNGVRPQGA